MTGAAFTVVVPAYGDAALPARLLRALDDDASAAGRRLRVIVSDDASPVPMEPALRSLPLRALDLEVVREERNAGPGAARNRALGRVATSWVAFLDADMVPAPGWVARLDEIADADDDAADGVEGRVAIPGLGDATPFTHATEFSTPGVHHGAGNVAYRTSTLRRLGGFDERFYDRRRRMHFREDSDLYFRMVGAGASVTYDDTLVAEHPPLASSYTAPMRLARRYYFDPLLAREHPDGFREMTTSRRVGPVSLRRARHDAATAAVVGTATAAAGLLTRRRGLALAGAAVAGSGYAATAVALSWRRTVRARHVVPLVAACVAVPWVYATSYWRGVVAFRYRPRLR